MKKIILLAFMGIMALGVHAQRVTDKLTRGLVAVPQGDKTGQDDRFGASGSGMFISWRKLPSDYFDTRYNLYRNGIKVAEALDVTNYEDLGGTATSRYQVIPVVKGTERADLKSEEVTPWAHQFWDITLKDVVNRAGNTVTSQYTINDCSVADVDGDGQMEFVLKRRNDSGLRDEGNTTNFNLHECYKMDGTRLWWIDMGPNMMAGPDEQFDLILYDWDGDGKAEALMRGADNMIIHTATGKTINVGDMSYYAPRDEYTKHGREYLIYLNGTTGEPYLDWDGGDTWTPMDFPLPRFEQGEAANVYAATEAEYKNVWGSSDTGHRSLKIYMGSPYLDGRNPSIFLGRGCYTRHKFCALDVDPATHKLTQRWRWNCYDPKSPWYGNGFHNFAIADVDMDGRDEIVFGSMIIDDNGYGLSTTGFGHGDAQHCGDLDPYRWGLEQFVCLEGANVPGIAYTDGMTSTLRFTTGTGGDNGRCMAGNFQNTYPGTIGNTFGYDVISLVADKVIGGMNMASDDYMNMRIYWDGDLLDEFMDSPGVERSPTVYKAPGQAEVHTGRSYSYNRCWGGSGALNNSSKNNPSFLGDIIGDWREEIVNRINATTLRINISSYPSPWAITSLWYDHEYRNGMTWQSVGYNQPPHPSFFLGEMEGITKEPPALTLEGRTEVAGTIQTTDDHLLISGYEDKTVSVAEGASPYILTVNTPSVVAGSGAQQAVSSTPKQPARTVTTYTTTLTGGAFSGCTRLVKQGEGVLVLPNVVEQHTGETDIWQGTLQFDGTFQSSPLWLNRHTTLITDGGRFLAGLKADYNATVYPGGKQHVGSVTTTGLALGFGSRIVFDYIGGSFDQVIADSIVIDAKTDEVWVNYGPRYKAPVLQFTGVEEIAAGTYTIGTVGAVSGDLSQIILEGFGTNRKAALAFADGKLQLVIEEMRPASTVVWNGTEEQSVWQQAVGENFLNGDTPTYAAEGDHIIFDDNAASTSVVIKGAVSPLDVTFNNETKAYTLSGDSIVGGAPIVKNGKGKLTISNWNHTGATTVNGGTVSVAMLANNSGQQFGSLGSVSSPIRLNDGATLETNGIIITDQSLSVSGNANINVPSGKSVIFNKAIRGVGAVITKTGTGSMETGTETNTYSKLVIKAGKVSSNYSSSNVDMLPETVEFQGSSAQPGILWGANKEGTPYLTNRVNFVVPKGKYGSFYGSYGGTYSGTLTGEGTFNVYTGGVRCYFVGDWSEFAGTINIGKENRQNKKSYDPDFYFENTNGLPLATVSVNENVRFNNSGRDIVIGKLTGKGTLVGSGNWILGSDGSDFALSTEIGITSSRTDDYGGTIAASPSKLLKRGAGKMRMSTLGKLNAALTVEEGTVTFSQASLETFVNGSNTTTVKEKGRIVGQGKFSSMVLQSGSELIPCGSTFNETTPGIIKTTAMLNAQAGSVVNFLVNATKQSSLQPSLLTMNGTVKLTLLSSYTPKAGDEFTLWTAGSFSGTPQFDLPELPEGLVWDTSAVAAKTGVLRIVEGTGIARIAADAPVDCQLFNAGGTVVARFAATRSTAQAKARQLGVQPGLYIVRMTDGRNTGSETVVIR